jgi:RNA polymerase sigma-70 factor (ECF subfamily)
VEVTDRELVAGGLAGDIHSVAVLVERHRPRMRAVAVSILGRGTDAEDVVQDAVVVALTTLDTLRVPDSAGAWLAGLTRNLSRQALARRSRGATVVEDLDMLPGAYDDPASVMETQSRSNWIWQAINGLSDAVRQAVVLRYFSNASSYEAIAGVLGVPVGTVRSRLSEGRRILSASLTDVANASHADHRAFVETRAELFRSIFAEYNQGTRCSLFRSALTADAELRQSGVPVEHGRERIGNWLESDLEIGIQLQLLDVIAGAGITVVEGSFVNPPEHPDHCPSLTTHVYLHDGDGIGSVRLYYPDAAASAALIGSAGGTS